MEIIERINNALNSDDIAVMKATLTDVKEFIQRHTLNYDLPEKWQINDLFRLTPEEYNKAINELLTATDSLENPANITELLKWLRRLISSYKNDTYGLPKTIILVSSVLDTIRVFMGDNKND